MTQRVSRSGAAAILGVSLTTLDRRIARGDIAAEIESHGDGRRVWVMLPDSSPDETRPTTSNASQVSAFEAQLAARDELIVHMRNQLTEAEARHQMLIERLEAAQHHADNLTARLLPPAPEATSAADRRRWWPFGKRIS